MKSHIVLLWRVGQLTSMFIGFGVSLQSNLAYGVAVGFALMVLVDIRRAAEEHAALAQKGGVE